MSSDYSEGPADAYTAGRNIARIRNEMGIDRDDVKSVVRMHQITDDLRKELERKGLRGFKRGGRVRRTGIYKLHAGEKVIPARKRRHRRK